MVLGGVFECGFAMGCLGRIKSCESKSADVLCVVGFLDASIVCYRRVRTSEVLKSANCMTLELAPERGPG